MKQKCNYKWEKTKDRKIKSERINHKTNSQKETENRNKQIKKNTWELTSQAAASCRARRGRQTLSAAQTRGKQGQRHQRELNSSYGISSQSAALVHLLRQNLTSPLPRWERERERESVLVKQHRQTDRQIDIQTDRHQRERARQTNKQAYRQRGRGIN